MNGAIKYYFDNKKKAHEKAQKILNNAISMDTEETEHISWGRTNLLEVEKMQYPRKILESHHIEKNRNFCLYHSDGIPYTSARTKRN